MHAVDWSDFHMLDDAVVVAQKLAKKLRQLSNAGVATPADVRDAKIAVASLRAIYSRHNVAPPDIDSRRERER